MVWSMHMVLSAHLSKAFSDVFTQCVGRLLFRSLYTDCIIAPSQTSIRLTKNLWVERMTQPLALDA